MKIVVITNNALQEEMLAQGLQDPIDVFWQEEVIPVHGADVYIDLLFSHSDERINQLKKFSTHSAAAAGPGLLNSESEQAPTIIVNSVNNTAGSLPPGFIRINGWNSFLKRPLVEVAGEETSKATIKKIFSCFNKKIEWVPDIPGFITARIISMIINEAWYTLDEKVSTKEEIDTAMKLGTNYPYGPFEWGTIIGLKNVYELLTTLAATNSRYQPSALLQKEILS